jgi:hypothetical protein
MALILPFLMIKMAPMPRVIGLLYVRPRSPISYRARPLSLPLPEVLGSRPSPVTGLLLDPIRVRVRHSCLRTVRDHTAPIFDGAVLIISRHTPNRVLSNPLLNVHVPFAMTDHLAVPPAHLHTVAPGQMCPLKGRDWICTEMSLAWMNELQ